MRNERTAAAIVGVLYIIGTAAGIASFATSSGISGTPASLAALAANANPAAVTGLLVLTMAVALAVIPAVLFPILRREHEVLAVGYVIFRGALEVPLLIAAGLTWLVLAAIAQQSAGAAGAAAAQYSALAALTLKIHAPIGAVSSIVFSIGAAMLYYAMFQLRLVPRWLTVWGLGACVLYLAAGVMGMFGPTPVPLYMPMALQEMVLAVWLIVKGFGPGRASAQEALRPAMA
jgi:hypothetical protein